MGVKCPAQEERTLHGDPDQQGSNPELSVIQGHCSKLIILGTLSTDVFETRTATGRRMQLLLVRLYLNQSVGKPLF